MNIKLLLLVAVSSLLTACGGKVDNTPEAITKAFVKALSSKDFDAAKGYCTATSGAAIDGLKSIAAMAPETSLEKEEVKCETNGDKATCKFCCAAGKGEETYNLVKEDGKWKVEYVKSGMGEPTEPVTEETTEPVTDPNAVVVDENMNCDEFLTKYTAFIEEYIVVLKEMQKHPQDATIMAKSKEMGDRVPSFTPSNKCLSDGEFSTKYLQIATRMTEAIK